MTWSRLEGSVGNDQRNRPEDVRRVSAALKSAGYLPPDDDHAHGYLTEPLVEAVMSYQSDNTLRRDGIVKADGPTADALLGSASLNGTGDPRSASPSAGRLFRIEAPVGDDLESRPDDVARVKAGLVATGDLDDEETAGPPGLLEGGTIDAIKRFQERRGLRADGWLRPGGETEGELDEEVRSGVQPANWLRLLNQFGQHGGRRLRNFVGRNFSDGYYWFLRGGRGSPSKSHDAPSRPYVPRPADPLPARPGPRSVPPTAKGADRRGEETGRPTAPGFPAQPPLKPERPRGRPAEPPIKDPHKPPEPEEPPKTQNKEELPARSPKKGEYILILPEPDDRQRGPMYVEMRGSWPIQLLDQRLKELTILAADKAGCTIEHAGGAFIDDKLTKENRKKQEYIKNPMQGSPGVKGTKGSAYPDVSFLVDCGGLKFKLFINSYDHNAKLDPTTREADAMRRIRRNFPRVDDPSYNGKNKSLTLGVTKPPEGMALNEEAYVRYMQRIFETILRGARDRRGSQTNRVLRYFKVLRPKP